MFLLVYISLVMNMAKLTKKVQNRTGSGLIPMGIAFSVIGIILLIGNLTAEPAQADISAADAIFIFPAILKLILAGLSGFPLLAGAIGFIFFGIADIIAGAVLLKKYGNLPAGRKLTAAEIAAKAEALENDYACGYLTKAEYEEQKRVLRQRSDR